MELAWNVLCMFMHVYIAVYTCSVSIAIIYTLYIMYKLTESHVCLFHILIFHTLLLGYSPTQCPAHEILILRSALAPRGAFFDKNESNLQKIKYNFALPS